MRPRLVRKRFTTRQFVHRNRVTYRKSVSISADVEHNTPHSYFPCIFSMYECFVSRDLSCDPFERVAKVVRCLFLLDAIPPVDSCRIQMCFSFRGIPLEEPQSLDAQSSTVMMSYIGAKCQECTKRLPTLWVQCSGFTSGPNCIDDVRILSAVDPRWMLAQASCCTRLLVDGRSRSRQRQRVQVRFAVAVLTLVVVATQFRQKAASISKATSRRRCSMPLLRKSNMMPKQGTRVCEFHVFFFLAESTMVHFMCCENCFLLRQVRAT